MRRILVKFSKQDEASFLSHRETMRCLERALRRSELPMEYTSGYNPHPRVSYSPALPLGVAAEAEYIEVAMKDDIDVDEARNRMNMALPKGLRVREIHSLSNTMPRLSRWARYGLYRVTSEEGVQYLLLSLGGEKQGRLKDALEQLASLPQGSVQVEEVTRVGLYASRDEVFEDVTGVVNYFDGENKVLMEIKNE